MLAALVFAMLGNALASFSMVEDTVKTPLIRRHTAESELYLKADGKIGGVRRKESQLQTPNADAATDATVCPSGNKDYRLGTLNSNSCANVDGAVAVSDPGECGQIADNDANFRAHFKATTSTDLLYGSAATYPQSTDPFTIDTSLLPNNDSPEPKNCFVPKDGDKIYYNDNQNNHTGPFEGTPICVRPLFPRADATGNCPTGYEAIAPLDTTSETEVAAAAARCHTVHDCVTGIDGAEIPNFTWDSYMYDDAHPEGCFVDHLGRFGFNTQKAPVRNHATTSPQHFTINGFIPVCQLAT